MGLSDIRISDREGSCSFWAFFQRCTQLRAPFAQDWRSPPGRKGAGGVSRTEHTRSLGITNEMNRWRQLTAWRRRHRRCCRPPLVH